MKKFKKLLAVLLGSALCFSAFALAACDEETSDPDEPTTDADITDTTETMGGGTSDASSVEELYTAAANTVSDIYTSETGYELAGDINYTYGGETMLDLTLLIDCVYNDGFNADLTASYYDGTYVYLSELLRGGDVYGLSVYSEDEITDEEIAATMYEASSLGAEIIDAESAIYSLLIDESGELADLSDSVPAQILGNIGGTVKQTSDGYTLSVDVASAASTLVTSVNLVLTYITLTQDLSQITVGDLLAIDSLKTAVDGYLNGITGEDVYTVINFAYEFISAINGETSDGVLGLLPEGTADQTAYDYIVAAVTALGYDSVTLEGLESTIESLQTTLSEIQGVLKELDLSYTLTYNTAKSLTGISVEFGYAPSADEAVTIAVSISITEKEVTLAAVPEQYIVGYAYGNIVAASVYNDCFVELLNDGTMIIYTYDDNGNGYAADIEATYTYENGVLTVTVGEATYEESDSGVIIELEDGTYELDFYYFN